MEIRLSESAVEFLKNTFDVSEGEGIRLKGTIDEESLAEDPGVPDDVRAEADVDDETQNADDNFSVTLHVAEPKDPLVETTVDGLLVFVEQEDDWFAEGKVLEMDFKNEETIYTFTDA